MMRSRATRSKLCVTPVIDLDLSPKFPPVKSRDAALPYQPPQRVGADPQIARGGRRG